MKALIGAVAVAAMFATSAMAQTATPVPQQAAASGSRCPELAPEPTFPDGATATTEQVAAGEALYQSWSEAARLNVQCRRTEYEELVTLAQTRREEHNQAAARLNALTNSWVAERDEYCARPRTRCEAPPAQ